MPLAIDSPVPARSAIARWRLSPRTGTGLVWLAMVATWILAITFANFTTYDPDDLLRLQQVRDLLGGQDWFDVTQYRMGPPDGASMHWSRIVDLPLAGFMLLFALFMSSSHAEYWATVAVPLLYLGAALFLVRSILLKLGFGNGLVLAGTCLAALFPLLPPAFAPMRIDHHTPQALAALACALLMLHAPSRLAAAGAGIVAAIGVAISLESLPAVALLAAAYGLRYALRADRSLAWFLGALAVWAPLLSLATRPVSEFALWCDILLPAHWASFAVAAAIALALPLLPHQHDAKWRLASLCLFPIACVPVAVAMLGPCITGPFQGMDPFLRTYWYDNVHEGLPVWKQDAGLALSALYTTVLIPAGLWAAHDRGMLRGDARIAWLVYGGLAFGSALYGLYLMRAMLNAQLLALPFAVALLARFMPKARAIRSSLPRIAATIACILLSTPAPASLLGKYLEEREIPADQLAIHAEWAAEGAQPCDIEALDALSAGHVFTTFNAAPAILANTHHTVEMGGYHRNAEKLRGVIRAFTSPERDARAIVTARHSDYLVACLQDDSMMAFAEGRPNSLAAMIMRGDTPGWLQPVPGYEGTLLRVYRVR